jgi:hypothetical protein
MAQARIEDQDELEALAEQARKDVFGTTLVVFTTLLLLVGIYVVEKALKDHFNGGFMADKKAAGTP